MSYELSAVTVLRYPTGYRLDEALLAEMETGAVCVYREGKFDRVDWDALYADGYLEQNEAVADRDDATVCKQPLWSVTMRDISTLKPWQGQTMLQAERDATGYDLLNGAAPELCLIAYRHFEMPWPARISRNPEGAIDSTEFVALWSTSFSPGDGWTTDDDWEITLIGELDMLTLHPVMPLAPPTTT